MSRNRGKGRLQHNVPPTWWPSPLYALDMTLTGAFYTYNNPRNKTKDPPTAPKNNERGNFCPWTGGGRDTTPKPSIDIQHFKKPNLSDHTSKTIFAPQMRTDFWTTRIFMSFLRGDSKKKKRRLNHLYQVRWGAVTVIFSSEFWVLSFGASFWVMINFLPKQNGEAPKPTYTYLYSLYKKKP